MTLYKLITPFAKYKLLPVKLYICIRRLCYCVERDRVYNGEFYYGFVHVCYENNLIQNKDIQKRKYLIILMMEYFFIKAASLF